MPHKKYTPSQQLTTKASRSELTHFVEFYKQLCNHYQVISDGEKCKGLIRYCSPKAAKRIERIPSYIEGDYQGLIEDLFYFTKEEDTSYNLAKVNHFTHEARKKSIRTMEQFKHYHEKFLELLGRAIGARAVAPKEYNRHLWEGIPRSLREKIEDRL